MGGPILKRVTLGAMMTAVAGVAGWLGMRIARTRRQPRTVTRLDAHLAAPTGPKFTPAKSIALRRDVQERFETSEATHDLAILDRLLADVRDLSGAEEAIFWRWHETRQTLVPSAWSSEGEPRPAFFDMRAWGALVRWSAEQALVQLEGEPERAPVLAAAPVLGETSVYGVLTVTAREGLNFDRDGARAWMPRFAAQVSRLTQLFDIRREYGRHMRQSEALLDAVRRLHGHRGADALAQALCDTAREVTSAPTAGLVRWNAAEQHGVVKSASPTAEIEAGFHVVADSMVGRACIERLTILREDGDLAAGEGCPYGGLPRPIGSLVVVPILSGDEAIGALVVEGKEAGDISDHESRNVGLLAAIATGPLEVAWEIEEVSKRARTDALTGLANRRDFDEQLRRVAAETDRFGGTCSLIMIDLDHFKQINDQFGHEAGDAVLKHVAQVLSDGVRTVDLCARYGGEELVVLLKQTGQQGAIELAERLRQAVESRPLAFRGRKLTVTASMGVATYPIPVPYGDWLVVAADKALYEAKAAGRNRVKVIHPNNVTPELYKPSHPASGSVSPVD